MRYHYYSLLREWSLLDKKLCSCITSQCMDGKLWKIEMRFFREAQTSMFGLDHPDRLRSVLEIRSQSLKLLASTEKWKAGHHVTPCLCHAATLKTIYNIIICHTHKHIIELTHTANFLKRTPLHSSWHSWVLVQTSTPRQCVTTWCGSWYIQCNTRTIQSNTSNLYQTSFVALTTIWPKYPISPRSLWRPLVALGWAIYKAFLRVAFGPKFHTVHWSLNHKFPDILIARNLRNESDIQWSMIINSFHIKVTKVHDIKKNESRPRASTGKPRPPYSPSARGTAGKRQGPQLESASPGIWNGRITQAFDELRYSHASLPTKTYKEKMLMKQWSIYHPCVCDSNVTALAAENKTLRSQLCPLNIPKTFYFYSFTQSLNLCLIWNIS